MSNAGTEHGCVKVAFAKGDGKEGVNSKSYDEDLGRDGQMVVYEAALLARVECRPYAFVDEPSVQGVFKDELSTEEKDCEKLE